MENVVNIKMFLEHLTYYIKMGIYVNKGTELDNILDMCIKLYNKLKNIEMNIDEENKFKESNDEIFCRKLLKRLNLVLKIDDNGNPVNINDKNNQINIIKLHEHHSLKENNLDKMMEYAIKNNINIFTNIPLIFMIRENKYQELLWQYTRSLFYISQILLTINQMNSKSNILKKNIFDNSLLQLEEILNLISQIEEKIKMNNIMALDNFLNNKLTKVSINEKNVNDAKSEVKEIFQKKGLGNNNALSKMVDSIADKITSIDIYNDNLFKHVISIAQNVASEMKEDFENDIDDFQNNIGTMTEVFTEAFNNSSDGEQIPDELKNILNNLISFSKNNNGDGDNSEIIKRIENMLNSNNPEYNEILKLIKDNDTIFRDILGNDDKLNILNNVLDDNNNIDIDKFKNLLNNNHI